MQQELGFKKPRDRGWLSRRLRWMVRCGSPSSPSISSSAASSTSASHAAADSPSWCPCLSKSRHLNVLSRLCKLHLSNSSIGQKQAGGENPKMTLNNTEEIDGDYGNTLLRWKELA